MPRPRRVRSVILAAVCIALALPGVSLAASRPAARARHTMVAGPEPLAVAEGRRVLREGGNAVDAAVTMGFVLAVTYPQAGNIGGGGYMLIRESDGSMTVIDYREVAPGRATRDMFLDSNGEVIPGASRSTYRAAGVPGTVAGLALALERHGTITLRRALEPAIRLAREGFIVGRGLGNALSAGRGRLERYPAARAIFFKGDTPLEEGDRLVQRDLAATLEAIARGGPGAFYEGKIASSIATDMEAHDGLVTREDLASYRALEKPPLTGSYRSWQIVSTPPSSSGGVALLEILHMLEPFDLRSMGQNSSAYVHVVAEAMKRAFADRSRWLGDPAFAEVPLEGLLSPAYASRMMSNFDPSRATPAPQAGPGDPLAFEKTSTTHYSILDASGGMVANTYTLNAWFGCGAVVDGLGFLLNNEMDDFSIRPGEPNMYGLVGGQANSIAPGKRMLSSMTPTFVLARDASGGWKPLMALGSPGGPTIITSVLQTMLNTLEFGMELQAAVDAPRFHHQWEPDKLFLDAGGFPADVKEALVQRGHVLSERRPHGDIQAILVDADSGWLYGASDPRGYGTAGGDD